MHRCVAAVCPLSMLMPLAHSSANKQHERAYKGVASKEQNMPRRTKFAPMQLPKAPPPDTACESSESEDALGFGDEIFLHNRKSHSKVGSEDDQVEQALRQLDLPDSSLFTRWWFGPPSVIANPCKPSPGCDAPATVNQSPMGDSLPLWNMQFSGSAAICDMKPVVHGPTRTLTTLVVLSDSGRGAPPLHFVRQAVYDSIKEHHEVPVPLDFFLTYFTDDAEGESVMHDVFVQAMHASKQCVFYMNKVDWNRPDVVRLQAIASAEGISLLGRRIKAPPTSRPRWCDDFQNKVTV